MPDSLSGLLAAALEVRAGLLAQLHAEETDAYRLFHGAMEGLPGLTVDRYGDLLLAQSFQRSLEAAELAALEGFYADALPGLTLIYNDRAQASSRILNRLDAETMALAQQPRTARELGVNYRIQARHEGQDPWLFLDRRAGRRRVMREAAGKSVLNPFAYTCGVGIAAAKAGARFVVNVEFDETGLRVGRENARLNDLPVRPRFLHSDVFAALRQFSGLGQARRVRGKVMPAFPKLEAQLFDLVFLDPPRLAKSPYGVVDPVNDYAAVFKLSLLSTAEGGTLICCNDVAEVAREAWLDQLQRSARKAGRDIRDMEWIPPEADFPGQEGQPPLKIALLRV